jgi:8-amino-7-oxononanoate synthase
MRMLDFTSALYLGLQHPSGSLPAWTSLTLGKPAALEEPFGSRAVEQELAALTGCDDALLATSTLHAFFDLFAMLAGSGMAFFLDQSSYPISRWAAQYAAGTRGDVTLFRAGDVEGLKWTLDRRPQVRPVIVTDGISPATGLPTRLAEYANLATRRGGLVVADDTQALGILGVSPNASSPYGFGGGGSLRHVGIHSDEVVVVNSLAKAFGVPVAMVGGTGRLISQLRSKSLMRTHCSPPSAAVISAAAHAIGQNRCHGERLRARLSHNVARLRRGLNQLAVAANRSLFPVQPLRLARAGAVHEGLLQRGIGTILQRNPTSGPQLSFLLTARHTAQEIDWAIESLIQVIGAARDTGAIGVYVHDSQP